MSFFLFLALFFFSQDNDLWKGPITSSEKWDKNKQRSIGTDSQKAEKIVFKKITRRDTTTLRTKEKCHRKLQDQHELLRSWDKTLTLGSFFWKFEFLLCVFTPCWGRGICMKYTLTSSKFALLIQVKGNTDGSGVWLLRLNISLKGSFTFIVHKMRLRGTTSQDDCKD